jgi:uncharacterized protein (DUF433 family)
MNLALESPPLPLLVEKDGMIRVGRTRVTLDTVVASFANGATAEQIAQDFPVLSLAEVYSVISYYLHHQQTVDDYLEEQREEGEAIQQKIEARGDMQGIRERLLARQQADS